MDTDSLLGENDDQNGNPIQNNFGTFSETNSNDNFNDGQEGLHQRKENSVCDVVESDESGGSIEDYQVTIPNGSKKVRIGFGYPSFPVNKEGLTLSWHGISAHVVSPSEKKFCRKSNDIPEIKELLRNVSGSAEPGHLLAIMGASGAGKTTLLNILTGRSTEKLNVEGEVKVNGRNLGRSITRISAYVQQDDLFIGTLTVREHLIFQAVLRMDKHFSYKERMQRVENVIQQLGLSKCSNTLIGVPGRIKGISGGEMKRLAFASEILTNPDLLFCDEPTSGLDSFMAQSVVSVLKIMAAEGRTIVSTIHQPSSEIYALFDRLLLLAEGKVAFHGNSRDAIDHFSKLGMRCPINFNPADFFIENLAVMPGREDDCRQKIKLICEDFAKSVECKESSQNETRQNGEIDEQIPNEIETCFVSYKASWLTQLRMLLWRCFLISRRERLLSVVRLFQTLAVSALIGLIYWGQEMTQDGIMNINGALFLIVTNLSFQNAMSVVTVFSEELPIFLREHWNGMYRSDTYFLSKTIAEIPIFATLPVVFICVLYWWIGLYPEPYHFLITIVVAVLTGNTACSYGYMISGVSKSGQIAASIVTPLMIPLLLFGGFFLNNGSVPEWLVWLKYLSWFYYSNEALVINQWKDVKDIPCSNLTTICIQNGTLVLESLHFNEDNLYPNLRYLVCLLIGFRLVAYLGVLAKSRKRR